MRRAAVLVVAAALAGGAPAANAGPLLPEIRLTPVNQVPACVTPDRLMQFLRQRNGGLDPRYMELAEIYKSLGEAWRVRWDYAFYQMVVETNFLTYRRPNGRMGDVDPRQNNFAGIGTTGGGVPGDSYPDIRTGVLAQIQHLVVYSGEKIAAPVAPRTQLKQDDILAKSRELNRPVRFSDLARRWAADRRYDQSIEWAAESFRSGHCRSSLLSPAARAEILPWAIKSDASTPKPILKSQVAPVAIPAAAPGPATPRVRTIWARPDAQKRAAAVPRPALAAAAASEAAMPSPPATPPVMADAQFRSAESPAPGPAAGPELSPGDPAAEAKIQEPVSLARFALVAPQAQFLRVGPPPATGLSALPDAANSTRRSFDPAATPPSGLGAGAQVCSVGTATYGGAKTVLIRTEHGGELRYTALSVLDGFEKSMTETFIRTRAGGGEPIGEFSTKDAALAKARELCPAS